MSVRPRRSARIEAGEPTADKKAATRPVKRSFRIRGHATSISLESAFWDALKAAAEARGLSAAELVADIDSSRGDTNLSSAVRVWILRFVGDRAKGRD